MNSKDILKSNQEQAVAAWVNYLNQVRLDRLVEFMKQQDINFSDAMKTMDETIRDIQHLIDSNRGGSTGMHGFIAEAAEVGFENIRKTIEGKMADTAWVNDNGAADLLRGGVEIQQKFYQSGLSLGAIASHLKKYPDFIENGGKYQIPKDQYEKIKYLLSISKEEANKMPTSDGTFSLRQWKAVQEFFEHGDIKIDDVEPSLLDYKDVQIGTIDKTIDNEINSIKDKDTELRANARSESMPTMKEGLKATGISAAIEGATALGMAIYEKKKDGVKISEFSEEDWKDIAKKTGVGTVKGGIRGSSIYVLTNFTATPAAVASAITTSAFGIAEQAHQLRNGDVTESQFIENSEMLCMDAAVSALSSFIGQAAIPIPVVGAVVGNSIGCMMYKIAKDNLNDKEQKIIKGYLDSINLYNEKLETQFQKMVDEFITNYEEFLCIIDGLYDVDVVNAFHNSVELAHYVGLADEQLLGNKAKIDAFFLD